MTNLKELDALEKKMLVREVGFSPGVLHLTLDEMNILADHLRPLLDLVEQMGTALACSTAGPGRCGNCNPCRALAAWERAGGK